MISRWRLVENNRTILDLVDLFLIDDFTRISGVVSSQISLQVFANNIQQPWAIISGAATSDSQILSGFVYWGETNPGSGLYGLRWRPNATGFWRLILTYNVDPQIVTLDYDVVAPFEQIQKIRSAFIRG